MPGRMLLDLNYEDGTYKDALKLMFTSKNFKVALKKMNGATFQTRTRKILKMILKLEPNDV